MARLPPIFPALAHASRHIPALLVFKEQKLLRWAILLLAPGPAYMLSHNFSPSYVLRLHLPSASFMSNTNLMSSGMYFWALQYQFLSDAAQTISPRRTQ